MPACRCSTAAGPYDRRGTEADSPLLELVQVNWPAGAWAGVGSLASGPAVVRSLGLARKAPLVVAELRPGDRAGSSTCRVRWDSPFSSARAVQLLGGERLDRAGLASLSARARRPPRQRRRRRGPPPPLRCALRYGGWSGCPAPRPPTATGCAPFTSSRRPTGGGWRPGRAAAAARRAARGAVDARGARVSHFAQALATRGQVSSKRNPAGAERGRGRRPDQGPATAPAAAGAGGTK
jgi:hypothetical protein